MLRFQLFATVVLMVAGIEIAIRFRTKGSLTGSRTAGAAARVPVEVTVRDCSEMWQEHGFRVGGTWC